MANITTTITIADKTDKITRFRRYITCIAVARVTTKWGNWMSELITGNCILAYTK